MSALVEGGYFYNATKDLNMFLACGNVAYSMEKKAVSLHDSFYGPLCKNGPLQKRGV